MANMKNKFEFSVSTKNAKIGCEIMDWLVENDVKHKITLADENARVKEYVFTAMCNRLNAGKVLRYFDGI